MLSVLVLALRGIWSRPLTSKDTIVLGNFEDQTGDIILGKALKQDLMDVLDQSPFLKLVSATKMRETLKLMNHPTDESLTDDVLRQVCVRTGARGLVTGFVAPVGDEYLVSLRAEDCQAGNTLAAVTRKAENRNKLLSAMSDAGTALRKQLGESLASVERSSPADEVTTPNLEALYAYTLGRKHAQDGDLEDAVQFYQQAIALDPNFARAYAALGITYGNLDKAEEATLTSQEPTSCVLT